MTAQIYIENVKKLDKGSQKMICNVRIGPLTIFGWKIVQPEGKEPFSAPPQIPVKSQDGTATRWFPMCRVEGDLRTRIDAAVFEAWHALDKAPDAPAEEIPF